MHRTFPVLLQVFSSCFTVPEVPVLVSVLRCPSRVGAAVRKAMSMPPPQHPTSLCYLLLYTPLLDLFCVTSDKLTLDVSGVSRR